MLRLEMLPAAQGDCLWLEYGTPPATRIVIIDGGVTNTATALRNRIDAARDERGSEVLEVELLIVTHIDNDHILGIIALLQDKHLSLRVKDIWFNGRPQLMQLPPLPPDWKRQREEKRKKRSKRPADLMGDQDDARSEDDEESTDEAGIAGLPADLLGTQEGDKLSELLAARGLPWNRHALWNGRAVMVPDAGPLPNATLDGNLKLTLLGPNLARLHDLCMLWSDVLGGDEDSENAAPDAMPADLLGRSDTWPPVWKDGEKRDPSVTNGSSIVLLAEYGRSTLLLTGDAYAADIASALARVCGERNAAGQPFPLTAFKLSHHGSERNLTKALLDMVDCGQYLVSTNGTQHRHPDHQALLRILLYKKRRPLELVFNYLCETTRPWGESKADVVRGDIRDYTARFPADAARGMVIELE